MPICGTITFCRRACAMWQEDAAERGVGFVVRRPPDNSLEAFLEEVEAALLIGDENPCREPERWRQSAGQAAQAALLDCRCRRGGALARLRPQLCAAAPLPAASQGASCRISRPAREDRRRSIRGNREALCRASISPTTSPRDSAKLDRCVQPVDSFTGGTHAALKRLGEFVSPNSRTTTKRATTPRCSGTSRLSPYLHFGNIGPLTIALAVQKAVEEGKSPAAPARGFWMS